MSKYYRFYRQNKYGDEKEYLYTHYFQGDLIVAKAKSVDEARDKFERFVDPTQVSNWEEFQPEECWIEEWDFCATLFI